MAMLIIVYLWVVGAATVYCLWHKLSDNHPAIKFFMIWLWPITVPVLTVLMLTGTGEKMKSWADHMERRMKS